MCIRHADVFERCERDRSLGGQVRTSLDEETLGYFAELSYETGVPYQTLINLYLRECADQGKPLAWTWYRKTKHYQERFGDH